LFAAAGQRKARRGDSRSSALSMRARMATHVPRETPVDSRSGNLTTVALSPQRALSLLPIASK
jgi:hypothetical protein